jgi:hypothetical protein
VTGVWMLAAAVVAVMVASELALGGTKLQTGLSRALAAWALVYLPTVYLLAVYGGVGPVALTIFWGGAFLSWFGVRSHIESSILLRMLAILRRRSLTTTDLVTEYTSHYGKAMRLEELLRGGLAIKENDALSVSPKGKFILGVVAKLR